MVVFLCSVNGNFKDLTSFFSQRINSKNVKMSVGGIECDGR